MMAAPIEISVDRQSLEPRIPVDLFPVHIAGGALPGVSKQQFAVAPDGQRFLVNLVSEEERSTSIMLLINWHPEQGNVSR
jgi:hypothetical protein